MLLNLIAFFGVVFLILVTGITAYVIKDKISPIELGLDEEKVDNLKMVGKDFKVAGKDQI